MDCLFKLKTRNIEQQHSQKLIENGIHPLLSRLLSSRGIEQLIDIHYEWISLLNPIKLNQIEKASKFLANSIINNKRILIVADYDCDGATACAVGIRGLRSMGGNVDFIVPNRFNNNYGLTPEIIKQACEKSNTKPDIIITVDNGIASVEGVEYAKKIGIDVIITDHHLPGKILPNALAIINPNNQGCNFPSKNLSGVGVIFYLMIHLRSEMRNNGTYNKDTAPKLNELVDLVALGTIADLVKLDKNNRLLVTQGLKRIRLNNTHPGIKALFRISNKNIENATTSDLGFSIAPKINAAGRLSDMSLGIHCLITNDYNEAMKIANKLNEINNERKNIQEKTNLQAIKEINTYRSDLKYSICLANDNWNHGIVGLVSSKLKEKYWKPSIAFAPSNDLELKGSGRSVNGINIKDILDLISKNYPGVIKQFGGHAMAVGLTINKNNFQKFTFAFEEIVKNLTKNNQPEAIIENDGSLEIEFANVETANLLKKQVWGSGFEEPVFIDNFEVISQKLINDKHLKLSIKRNNKIFDAICFDHKEVNYKHIKAVYKLDINVWNGASNLQLVIQLIIPNKNN
ncbi:single-stranded-DNA-specific exonuclease [Candidatus Kinetoplastibacterium desouzaii TCC079E]|uniref:Single-stranded-DNA-specific exonuclease RecJ n=1 Tax=Candidatus Kinetoplastidibacterium desouzai TCC079E TaxID=1208919 RepID=M1M3N7_9PROT|nr:single-stranded-DNA-specific exonuclease RecJ [Candidatus Kinetoplastibacterium desouzaii]AGF46860.1 single-stranded-DNA-specific exonuclease [Candidatus Kinetoplastibacterium desouzaii TCC079E]